MPDQIDHRKPDKLRSAVSRSAERVRELTAELDEARRELAHRERELASVENAESAGSSLSEDSQPAAPSTAEGRVGLFQSLFRGRDELYALMWNDRTGRTGYSPACENKWQPGVCNIRKVPCGRCPNQAFLPMNGQAVYRHLAGPDVVGLYPLLTDNSCWLLAADFDKKEWDRDVAAFRAACNLEGVPVAIERSRSGNGAHAWIFFSEPVPAVKARQMGSFLITRAISARHSLGFSSYDRLFPNQDTMPKGGFGNLIALPLQHAARKSGNSVFVDEEFEPFPDQWGFLAGIRRMAAAEVEAIAEQALETGLELGLGTRRRSSSTGVRRAASSQSEPPRHDVALPARLDVVLDSKLRIPKAGLPSPLLSDLKRLAAFQNPEFYKRERMRLSVAFTPRVIRCFEEDGTHLALPRGCRDAAAELLQSAGTRPVVADRREFGEKIDVKFWGALAPDQAESLEVLAESEMGILVAPPGSGKTVLAISLIASRKRNTLVLVNRQHLLDQWVKMVAAFLDIEEAQIGRIGGGVRRKTGFVDVATFQSVFRQGEVNDAIHGYGQVIVDESHHVPAFSFERVLSNIRSRFFVGLTATPKRRDGLHPISQMQLGPIVRESKEDPLGTDKAIRRSLIVRETGFEYPGPERDPSIHAVYDALLADESRNAMIVSDIAKALSEGKSPIVLTERLDHLDLLGERLRNIARHLVVLKGGSTAVARRRALESLATIPDCESRVILATGRYVGEGFDDSRLDSLFLTMPISGRGVVVQYAGRLNRPHPGKSKLLIYDYADTNVPMLGGMHRRRLAAYRKIGFSKE